MCEHCPSIRGAYCSVCQSYHVADTEDTLEIDLAGAKTGPLPRIAPRCAGSTIPARCEVSPTRRAAFAANVLLACALALVGLTVFKLLAG